MEKNAILTAMSDRVSQPNLDLHHSSCIELVRSRTGEPTFGAYLGLRGEGHLLALARQLTSSASRGD